MKTAVLSFRKRTSNDTEYERGFIDFLNGYTIYVDKIVILSNNDDNGLIEALSTEYDLAFILNGDRTEFYLPSVLAKLKLTPDKEGFCGDKKVVSVVPFDYKGSYVFRFENALNKRFSVSFDKLTFKLYGVKKEEVEEVTARISEEVPSVFFNVSENLGDVKTCLVYGDTAPKKQVDKAVRIFIRALKNHIYAEDDITLSQRLYDVVKLRKQKICTAESMTGGTIASKIVSVDGASDIFYESLVTYDTLAKERRLGVKHSTVMAHTVVSEQVAYEMAKGLLDQQNCTLAITVTGYAGSDVHPSSDDGLCYICIGTKEKIQVYKYRFDGKRKENIEKAANAALFLAIKTVENLDSL